MFDRVLTFGYYYAECIQVLCNIHIGRILANSHVLCEHELKHNNVCARLTKKINPSKYRDMIL